MCAFLLDLPNFLDCGGHTYDMKTMACSYDRTASYSYTVFFITMFVTIPLVTVLFCNINIYIVVVKSKLRVAAHKTGGTVAPGSVTAAHCASTGYTTIDDSATISRLNINDTYDNHVTILSFNRHKETILTNETPITNMSPSHHMYIQTSLPKNNASPRNMKSEVKLAKTLFIVFIVFCCCWAPYALICLIDRYDQFSLETYAYSILLAHASSTINSILYALSNKGFRDGYKTFFYTITCRK